MNEAEITKEIILKLIEKDNLFYEQFPEAKTYIDVVCAAYKQIFKTVYDPSS